MGYEGLPSELVTGNDEIDDQHQKLLETVESILSELDTGENYEEVKRLLDFLVAYIDEHFEEEESVMLKNRYPEFAQHKSEHDLFKMRIRTLHMSRQVTNHNHDILVLTVKEAKRWIIQHVMKSDIKLARYLKGIK
ncbi:MAG: hypothetical protein C0602_06700 [Denitrovibrio sp.]|nr:MAG: hypothetical protein C0602_06700 [Denitrovibrio sp.]